MANRIKEIRESRNVTLEELAERLGTSKGQVAALQAERRQLTLAWLQRLALALDCKVSDLLVDDDVATRLSPAEECAVSLFRKLKEDERGKALRLLAILGEVITEQSALRLLSHRGVAANENA